MIVYFLTDFIDYRIVLLKFPTTEEEFTVFKLSAEVEADIRGLVVTYVLHDERMTIDRLGKQGCFDAWVEEIRYYMD